MMNITIFSLPNGQQIMGKIVHEDDDTITLDGPITIGISDPMSPETAIYTSRFMPLAKDWTITFHKMNIVSFSFIEESLVDHYESMVDYYKSRPFNYSSERTSKHQSEETERQVFNDDVENNLSELKNKTFH